MNNVKFRYYQDEGILAIYKFYEQLKAQAIPGQIIRANPAIAHPGGTGKSIIIAGFVKSVLNAWPTQRIICLTHVKELIDQNYKQLLRIWPMAPAGIFSSGLNRKEIRPITFAGIQSVATCPQAFGWIDLLLVDEAHLISTNESTEYQIFIGELLKINPRLRVIGFTATPYRMGQGLITEPVMDKKGNFKPPLFTHIIDDRTSLEKFNRFIYEGFLCRLITKQTKDEYNIENVRITGGEYNQKDLQNEFDQDLLTQKVCAEMIGEAAKDQRRRWLVFAAGVEHTEHVAREFQRLGIDARFVHSDKKKVPEKLRDENIAWFKSADTGEIRCMVNNGILTTGFDCPQIDLIGVCRATRSTSLWVQILSRGTRMTEGKRDCLILDFAGNTKRLGPINDPILPKPKNKKPGEEAKAPIKVCPVCLVYNHATARFCSECQHEFKKDYSFNDTADNREVIKESKTPIIEVFEISHITYKKHIPKDKLKNISLKVTYHSGIRMFNEWVCFEHTGFPLHKAHDWWRDRSADAIPETVDAVLDEVETLTEPTHVRVLVNAQQPEILAFDFTGTAFGTEKVVKEETPF